MSDDRFHTGVTLFNKQAFFECHDAWEDLWMDTVGPAKLFYQGMIQAAVAFYHEGNGNSKGAAHLFERSLQKLATYPRDFHNVDLAALCDALQQHKAYHESVLSGAVQAGLPEVPSIHPAS
jgi:uncharacterized protein